MKVPLTPIRFLRYAHDQFPDRIAVVCDDQRFTYSQLAFRASHLAGALKSLGAVEGDRIAFLSTNCHRLLEAYFGVVEAGCVLLPLNVRLSGSDIAYMLNDSGARILFIESRFVPLAQQMLATLTSVEHLVLLDGRHEAPWLAPENYEDLLERSSAYLCDFMRTDEDSVAELFYTSGTSDRPKGVMLTHRNVYLHALNVIVAMQTSPTTIGYASCEDVQLHTIPLFHANGWGAVHAITVVGGRHAMIHQFDPEQVFRIIERERVQSCCMVPAMALALIHSPMRSKYDLSSLRRVIFGGAAASPTLIRSVHETFGCVCFSGYGLTETSPVLALSPLKAGVQSDPADTYAVQATTGFAIPGVELRVVKPDGSDVEKNGHSIGEIVARGDGVMAGYWKHPSESKSVMSDGWFHTGDLATWQPNNYVHIVDRQKDIIISGGENISSIEIENLLLSHPTVMEAAVIPVPDPRWGEVPRAIVTLKPGCYANEDELLEFCRTTLAHYKCPRLIDFVDALPKNGVGKVLKYELRKKYWSVPAATA